MRLRTVPVITAFATFAALAQTVAEPSVDRALNFTNPKTDQDMQEIATVIRTFRRFGRCS